MLLEVPEEDFSLVRSHVTALLLSAEHPQRCSPVALQIDQNKPRFYICLLPYHVSSDPCD